MNGGASTLTQSVARMLAYMRIRSEESRKETGLRLLVLFALCRVCVAAEYQEHDIVPQVKSVAFTPETVALTLTPAMWGSLLPETERYDRYFLLHRSARDFLQVSKDGLAAAQDGDHVLFEPGAMQSEEKVAARQGLEIIRQADGCETEGIVPTRISMDGASVTVFLDCLSAISSVERLDGDFWIGTAYGSDGVVVTSAGGTVKKRIDTGAGGYVSGMFRDPWSDDTWLLSSDRLIVVGPAYQIEKQYWPIHDFDRRARRPDVVIARSDEHLASLPLAIYAYALGEAHYERFHDAVKDDLHTAERHTLYWWFMARDVFSHQPRLPHSLIELLEDAEPTNAWRQFACRLHGDRAKSMCLSDPSTWNLDTSLRD